MSFLYIASDHPGSGRTAMVATLSNTLEQRGITAIPYKPLYLTDIDADQPDPDIQDYERIGFTLPIQPIPMARKHIAMGLGNTPELRNHIEASLGNLDSTQGVTIIEGLPGLAPEDPTSQTSADLADLMDAKVIALFSFTPKLETATLIDAQKLFGNRLIGIAINGVSVHLNHSTHNDLLPSASGQGLPMMGSIPEDRLLLSTRVGDIAELLNGEIIVGKDKANALVEHLMLGVNVMEDSTLYFNQTENKAVVVRGDRPDIQMGALATSTTCLVLTGGIEPTQYVQYHAEQESVAIVQVPHTTLETARRMNSLVGRARFDHPAKLRRFQEILALHLDLSMVLPDP